MFICQTCQGYVNSNNDNKKVVPTSLPNAAAESTIQKEASQQQRQEICSICLGFWSSSSSSAAASSSCGFAQRLDQAVKQAVQPYHDDFSTTTATTATTRCLFSRHATPPRMNLPGDFIARLVAAQKKENDNTNNNSNNNACPPATNSVADFAQDLKLHAKSILDDCLNRIENNSNSPSTKDNDEYPPCVKEEEQGYLAIYVIVLPARHISRPYRATRAKNGSSHKKSRRRQQQQQTSHGNQQGFVQQGGDPFLNLENKVQAQDKVVIWTMNQALNCNNSSTDKDGDDDDFFSKPLVHAVLDNDNNHLLENGNNNKNGSSDHPDAVPALDIYVAVWRRPFYLQSMYTKTRRDVSQTPFYVVDFVTIDNDDSPQTCSQDGQSPKDDDDIEESATKPATNNKRTKTQRQRRKLGVTSVEEEILPTITKYAGGISTLNNVHDGGCSINSNNMAIQFGMAKFHASGREDMDVCMLLPSAEHTSNNHNITGRPFVCEMIDAYRLPPMSSLSVMVNEINHTTTTTLVASTLQDAAKDNAAVDDKPTVTTRAYGQNPLGVEIAPCLKFVQSSSFKNLQAMTESKVKYYCCLCWSEKPLSSLSKEASTLDEILGKFPKEIQQRTPLRVLHRRPNIIRQRHVLSCRATPIDEHHFRLHLNTDAGTCKYNITGVSSIIALAHLLDHCSQVCIVIILLLFFADVKEFVHGDLGRTIPSIGSLLGCKADILQLDCEGIESHFDE
jgi:tRNA U54 and U55 pseudouridine synthase Pus10